MPIQTKIQSQGLLFSEPSIAETGVWCQLSDDIDPGQWAQICRFVSQLSAKQFRKIQCRLYTNPSSFYNRLKRIFTFDQSECEHLPLVKTGY